jgi:hypothetical protein
MTRRRGHHRQDVNGLLRGLMTELVAARPEDSLSFLCDRLAQMRGSEQDGQVAEIDKPVSLASTLRVHAEFVDRSGRRRHAHFQQRAAGSTGRSAVLQLCAAASQTIHALVLHPGTP